MPIFLTNDEHAAVRGGQGDQRVADFYWALLRRVETRCESPGLLSGDETVDWWRPVAEYLTDAAMAYALRPTDEVACWLRDVTLSLVRRPQDDWVGPHYRDHTVLEDGSQIGHLETAHFAWAVAVVLDLASDVFEPGELDEVRGVLRERGIKMCLNWLDRQHPMTNWYCVLCAGLTMSAAVLGDTSALERAKQELSVAVGVLQADGSHAESLQYANYAINCLVLVSETLRRTGHDVEAVVPLSAYVGYARWAATSYLYSRPLVSQTGAEGWGSSPKPRSLNFNDSGAVFKPTADLLLHLAVRGRDSHPTEAGLARWLFEETYAQHPGQGPHDQGSFGLITDWGFMTPVLLTAACGAVSPAAASLEPLQVFDCGDTVSRDAWSEVGGRTVVALHGGGELLNGPGHLHHDLNTLIVTHRDERLLIDAGHGCYRNATRQLDLATEMHNTCTFLAAADDGGREAKRLWAQNQQQRRMKRGHAIDDPVDRGAYRLMAATKDQVRVMGSDAAASYGGPIKRFSRFVIQCGTHVVFVVDIVGAERPVKAQWHWLLNNRDGGLDLKMPKSDRVVVRRGNAGMKLFSLSGVGLQTQWAQVHDAYHCLPGRWTEGRSGSGVLLHWWSREESTTLVGVHAMALDSYGRVAGWHFKASSATEVSLEGPAGSEQWDLQAGADSIRFAEKQSGQAYNVSPGRQKSWELQRLDRTQ
ncbi:MAG: heparinase II/III family protein [Planctomycetota bacterium]